MEEEKSYENVTCNSRSLRSSLRPALTEFKCRLRFVSVSIFIHCNVYTSFYFRLIFSHPLVTVTCLCIAP